MIKSTWHWPKGVGSCPRPFRAVLPLTVLCAVHSAFDSQSLMSATPGKLLKQAKQGDPKAIAALMNRSTQAKGISVKASLKNRCLQVLLEGDVVPHQSKTVEFVRDGMGKLQVEGVERVKVYGRQVGQETPVWQEEIVLANANPFDEDGDDQNPSLAGGDCFSQRQPL